MARFVGYGLGVMKKTLSIMLLLVVVLAGSLRAETSDFPGVEKAMPAEEFEQAGLNKLTSEERARLDQFIRSYVASSSEQAATAAVDRAVKEKKVKVSEPEVIASNIVGPFTGYNGRSRFTLENGQVWAQSQQVARAVSADRFAARPDHEGALGLAHVYRGRRRYPGFEGSLGARRSGGRERG